MDKVLFEEELDLKLLEKELKMYFRSAKNIAVKLHMGEKGNTHYLKPGFVRKIVKVLQNFGASPFLFDSPVMYPGGRDTPEKYLATASAHGFDEKNIGCPVIISDDSVKIKTEHLDAEVCKPLIEAHALLVLTHVKGHMCCGFGGAIKNLGMGGVSKKTKADIHNFANPMMVGDCKGCGTCVKICPGNAISLKDKAYFNLNRCWGCGQCIAVCPSNVLKPKIASFDTLIAEGASAVLKDKQAYFINVIKDITRLCDCASDPGGIVLEDVGTVMGSDIVAVEKASLDLINKKAGKDIFEELHHKSPLVHIKEAQKLGLGNLEYQLK